MAIPRFISSALGLRGLSAAQDVMRSPWSNSDHLGDVIFHEEFGINARGRVSRDAAIGCATVAGVRDVIAGRIFRLPLIEHESTGQPAARQPAYLTQPEKGRPRSQTILWTVDELIFHGRAFWQVTERNAEGRPSWFRLVPDAQAETNTEGQLIRAFGEDVTPRDAIRIDGPHEGLLVRGAGTIRRAIRLDRAAARAENNPVPSIDLHNESKNELTKEQIKELIDSWNRARETSGVGYSSAAIKVNALGLDNQQLMIDGRRAITLELLRHMGAGSNPEIVAAAADGSTLNYTNKASREQALIDNVLALYMTAIEDRLSLDDISAHGRQVRFNTDVLTREDTATRYANYKTGKEIGLLSDDDIKKAEGKA